jgi:hypothetical protein
MRGSIRLFSNKIGTSDNEKIRQMMASGMLEGREDAWLKWGPSFMDPIGLMTDPIDELKNKLLPPFGNLLRGIERPETAATDAVQLAPVAGTHVRDTMTAARNISASGNPIYGIPSVVSRTVSTKRVGGYRISSIGSRAFYDKAFTMPKYRSNTVDVLPYGGVKTGKAKLASTLNRAPRVVVPFRMRDLSRYRIYGR